MRLEDKFVITLALVEYGKNIAHLRPISNFGYVGYGMQIRYIFLYSTRACVITYTIYNTQADPSI